MYDIVQIDGVNPLSASVFNPDCSWPITDWTQKCPPDQVVGNMPSRLGYWVAGTRQPMIIDGRYDISTGTVTADNCHSPQVKYKAKSCEMIAPSMREISLETEQLNVMDLVADYCYRRNVLQDQLCPFNPDGSFNPGVPWSLDFAQWVMAETYQAWAYMLAHTLMVGDDSKINQIDGFYTQLRGGWQVSPNSVNPCPNYFNTEQAIDWKTLTGSAGPARPDAQTIAGQTINLWGTNVSIPAGMTLPQLLERYWFDMVENYWTRSRGGVTQWEMHSRLGFAQCMAETAACMQPCGNTCPPNVISDPDLRARFALASNTDLIKLYPSGRVIPNFGTNFIEPNTMRIGPRQVGGRPTYQMFWDDISRYFSILSGGSDYGGGYGRPQSPNPPLWDSMPPRYDLEGRAIRWDFLRTTTKCLQGFLLSRIGILVCSRHLWLRIDNVTCDTEILFPQCHSPVYIDGVQLY